MSGEALTSRYFANSNHRKAYPQPMVGDKKQEDGGTFVQRLKVGVVGVGFYGKLHARVYNEVPTAELIAVADIGADAAKKAGEELGCEYHSDPEKMYAREDIQAVSICVPDEHHLEPAVRAAEAGKHILVEKPIASTAAEGKELRDAAKDNGVRVMVGHLLRFDPRYVQVKEQIDAGELGELVHIRAKRQVAKGIHRRLQGRISMLFYTGIHEIDIVRWYANSDVREVYAKKVSKMTDEDCVFVLLEFESGAVGTLEFSFSLPETFRRSRGAGGLCAAAEVVGTEGAAYIGGLDQGVQVFSDGFYMPDTMYWPEFNGKTYGDLRTEIMHFTDAVVSGEDFLVSTDDAIKAVAVIEAIFRSLEEKRPVSVQY